MVKLIKICPVIPRDQSVFILSSFSKEFNTTKKIREILTSWGIRLLPTNLKTGVFAEIGQNDGPILGLRADIDALPIDEAANVTFRSKNPGVMHACGHDTHIVSLLGGAYLLKQQEQVLPGRVRLIFQLAEEADEGALQVIHDGKIKDLAAIIGFHNTPNQPVGQIGFRAGITSGAIDKFKVTLTGIGTHASAPQNGQDPIVALGAEIGALQTVISRQIDPLQGGVLSITHVAAGNTWNIIPETAFFEGTVRTTDKKIRQTIKTHFFDIVNNTAKAYGTTATITWYTGDPSVDNDKELTQIMIDESSQFTTTYDLQPRLGSDDFSCYQTYIPGVYANIGNGGTVSNHNSRFTAADETVIYGTKFFERNAIRLLKELSTN
ncbi:amidohydrolase [Loigolactobacillus backii]|uniref:amidohydrolase n=1 Tax=Loigolactobacillus backii TaxID=375175 RepID=UPI0009489294|nr:amidohydrolase [Loigolactobacillus backii]PIO86855.1 iron permease [Loigolactobacillus backii]